MKQYTQPRFAMTNFDIEDILMVSGTVIETFAGKSTGDSNPKDHILSIPFSSLKNLNE